MADWAKPTCRPLESPIAETVYGLVSGSKSTRMDSPATRMNEVGVSRSPLIAMASAPPDHSWFTTARTSLSDSTATSVCGVVPGRALGWRRRRGRFTELDLHARSADRDAAGRDLGRLDRGRVAGQLGVAQLADLVGQLFGLVRPSRSRSTGPP